MRKVLNAFLPLYVTTLLMLLGSGLLTTYVSLRLAHEQVSGTLIGAIIAANYVGLVVGGKVGHNLIARVGHIRAYVACAGIITASVIGHGLTNFIPLWIFLRLIIGLCMMCQYMVLESWLNDQAESSQRGVIFGLYMVATYLGLSGGQVILATQTGFGISTLLIVALCFALCLVPIALTTRTNAKAMSPAPMELGYFVRTIPKLLATTLVSGMAIGAFYGLAPVFASEKGFTTEQTGMFMSLTIFAGLVSQFPLSWLSDRFDRQRLLFIIALLYAIFALVPGVLLSLPYQFLLGVAFAVSMMQFSLYPLQVALANDQVMPERRVSLTACLLMAFGIGASIGPLIVGAVMQPLGSNMLYIFFAVCAVVIALLNRPAKLHPVPTTEVPLPHVVMPDSLATSPIGAALNPVLEEEDIQAAMVNTDEEAELSEEQEEQEEQTGASPATGEEAEPGEPGNQDETAQGDGAAKNDDAAKTSGGVPDNTEKPGTAKPE
ncbi:MFS transporter [Mangrovibacter plantisponsor]|uniref:Cyanate permease n=1 Tax=Mangrovibacter plantisponsor TaxID=451513 RepID=A0A317PYC3_9ENTR|nr:MFS transporter [Mangrovibacter plantisponsor]PWW08164.1 cyanate permease [Mangrovibacter plantisponsor]